MLCEEPNRFACPAHLAPVVQKLDSAIHRINLYPVDNAIGFPNAYPLDSDLSGAYRYPTFEQLGPPRLEVTNSKLAIFRNI